MNFLDENLTKKMSDGSDLKLNWPAVQMHRMQEKIWRENTIAQSVGRKFLTYLCMIKRIPTPFIYATLTRQNLKSCRWDKILKLSNSPPLVAISNPCSIIASISRMVSSFAPWRTHQSKQKLMVMNHCSLEFKSKYFRVAVSAIYSILSSSSEKLTIWRPENGSAESRSLHGVS